MLFSRTLLRQPSTPNIPRSFIPFCSPFFPLRSSIGFSRGERPSLTPHNRFLFPFLCDMKTQNPKLQRPLWCTRVFTECYVYIRHPPLSIGDFLKKPEIQRKVVPRHAIAERKARLAAKPFPFSPAVEEEGRKTFSIVVVNSEIAFSLRPEAELKGGVVASAAGPFSSCFFAGRFSIFNKAIS